MAAFEDTPSTKASDTKDAPAPTSHHAPGAPARRSHLRRALSVLILAPATWGFIAVAIGESLWIPSLMRDLTSHVIPAMALAALLALRSHRFIAAILNSASLVLCLVTLIGPRAPRAENQDGADAPLRVLQMNALTPNPHHDQVLRLISDPALDVISLIECPVKLSRSIRADEILTELNRVEGARNPPYTQWILLLSRWPMERWESDAGLTPGLVAAVIHAPAGPVGVVSLHAAAPWETPRWRAGNTTIKGAALVASEMRRAGLPVMVVGDLNATPLSARTTWLQHAGLRRSKPALLPAGTFPSWLPWPLRIAIDDAVVSEEFRVQRWDTFQIPGSDHLGLSLDLVVPGQNASR